MIEKNIAIPYTQIEAFCQKHHIRKLALFGSVLRDSFSSDSDVDVLVEFDPDHIPGWEFVAMQDELTAILGMPVELNTAGFLSRHFRQQVLDNAQVIYERMR